MGSFLSSFVDASMLEVVGAVNDLSCRKEGTAVEEVSTWILQAAGKVFLSSGIIVMACGLDSFRSDEGLGEMGKFRQR